MPFKDPQAKLRNAERYRNAHKDRVSAAVQKWRENFKKDAEGYALYIKERNLQSRYGINVDTMLEMIDTQEGLCGLCKKPFGETRAKSPAVDHDHSTGRIRGILHQACNMAIGHLGDSEEGIQNALNYFSAQSGGVDEHY